MSDSSPCSLLPYADEAGVCDRCGAWLGPRRRRWCSRSCNQLWVREHRWTQARRAAVARDRHRCTTCSSTDRLEVNHIVPRNGAGYGWGCHHHLDNLETLCHDCHVKVTNQQRRDRQKFTETVSA